MIYSEIGSIPDSGRHEFTSVHVENGKTTSCGEVPDQRQNLFWFHYFHLKYSMAQKYGVGDMCQPQLASCLSKQRVSRNIVPVMQEQTWGCQSGFNDAWGKEVLVFEPADSGTLSTFQKSCWLVCSLTFTSFCPPKVSRREIQFKQESYLEKDENPTMWGFF